MMKIIILSLAALLLLENVVFVRAEAVKDDDEFEDTPRNRLLLYAIEEYSEIAKYTVEETVSIFKKVIRDASSSRNREMQTHLAKIADFVEIAEKLESVPENDQLEKLFDLFEKAIDLHDTFDTDEIKDPSEAVKEINRLLEKHGGQEFIMEFLRRFLNFIKNFKEKVTAYISSIKASDDQKMVDWFGKLKAEKDIEKKLDIFSEFFDLYD